MSDSDRTEESRGPRKRRSTYARGGSVSDMARLLATSEREPESRLIRRLVLVMAGVAIAVVVTAALWFLGG